MFQVQLQPIGSKLRPNFTAEAWRVRPKASLPQTQPATKALRSTRAAMLRAGSFQARSSNLRLYDLELEGGSSLAQSLEQNSTMQGAFPEVYRSMRVKASLATCWTLFELFTAAATFEVNAPGAGGASAALVRGLQKNWECSTSLLSIAGLSRTRDEHGPLSPPKTR